MAEEAKAGIVMDWYDVMSLHWMARRYADGRSSYSPGLFNGIARKLIAAGVDLKRPLFARDGMGRRYDGLSDEDAQAAEDDMPRGFRPEGDARLADALEALRIAEWGNYDVQVDLRSCPVCAGSERTGHTAECKLRAALDAHQILAKNGSQAGNE